MKIEIKSIFGSLLFEHNSENNTIKETIKEAIKSKANLRWANLSKADLSWADLSKADLSGANLSGADLRGADLSGADLSGADLRGADLRGADLSEADGIDCAQLNFSSHGEKGRRITAVKSSEEIFVFCGCFNGTVSELRSYIDKGSESYKKSRTLALDTVLMLLKNNL